MRRALPLALALGASACPAPTATPAQCRAIVARIIALELEARGLGDPALGARWSASLEEALAGEIARCADGHALDDDAEQCIAESHTTEELIRDCLR